jgi:putative intracellular protease/amidase
MELRAELEGKRIAILVDTLYQEMEVWYPLFRLQEAGAEVVLVAAEAGKTYTSKLGYPAKSDRCYDTLSAKDFDGVVIPEGMRPTTSAAIPKPISSCMIWIRTANWSHQFAMDHGCCAPPEY